MNFRIRPRFIGHRAILLLWMATSLDGFTVSPSVDCNQQRVKCRAQTPEENSDEATMSTALCLIPPDNAWDTIQRARHLARDRTYHHWPPAIRLFHPFCPRAKLSDKALDIARIVEEYEIRPFEVSLNSWTILPNMEEIEADWDAMRQLPKQEVIREKKKVQTEADRLIAEEERIGRQRKWMRQRKRKRNSTQTAPNGHVEKKENPIQQSPRDLLEKQKQQYEEFNGPCVLCLEPDEESKERLFQLREILRSELFQDFDKFSPSSSVCTSPSALPRAVSGAEGSTFRPVVPIGSFPTVTGAVEMARKLKGLWEPLPFTVTDFHLICNEDQASTGEKQLDDFSNSNDYNIKTTSWRHVDIERETLTAQRQFGCDALVMLLGEEVDTDEVGSKEMVNIIMDQGSPGGYALVDEERRSNGQALRSPEKDKDDDDATDDLELWLDEDDDWDEGSVIVIGRTHYFTGEMRSYNGMPASSVTDGKDRVLGEGVDASTRRKGSSHRFSNV